MRRATLVLIAALALPLAPARARAEERDLQCLIHPLDVVGVSAPVGGIVEKILVDRGDLVEPGQVLVHLEASAERAAAASARGRTEVKANIKSSEVRMEFGNRRFVRTEEMFRRDLIPLKEKDEAETAKVLAELGVAEAQENRDLAKLDLERAVAALDLKVIRSPVRGVVLERLASPGESAVQGPLLRIAVIDPLRVEVRVPVSELGTVRRGMTAEVRPEAPVGGVHTARVTIVDRVADPATGSFGVRLELPNPEYQVPAGLKCTARLAP